MPQRCIVGGCSNTNKDGVHLHRFPRDDETRQIWTTFVQHTRWDFKGPSATSVICSAHFTEDCYDPSWSLKERFGMTYRKEVLPGKYPTLIPVALMADGQSSTGSKTVLGQTEIDGTISIKVPGKTCPRVMVDSVSATSQPGLSLSSEGELSVVASDPSSDGPGPDEEYMAATERWAEQQVAYDVLVENNVTEDGWISCSNTADMQGDDVFVQVNPRDENG